MAQDFYYHNEQHVILEISMDISFPVKVSSKETNESLSDNHCKKCGDWLEGNSVCGECGHLHEQKISK